MAEAGTRFEDLAAVAVTQGPGLVGSLLVGLQAAKAIALVHGKPLVPVHHVAGHVAAAFLAHGEIPLPAIALVVSGGHTSLYERARGGRPPLAGPHPRRRGGRGFRQGREAAGARLSRRPDHRPARARARTTAPSSSRSRASRTGAPTSRSAASRRRCCCTCGAKASRPSPTRPTCRERVRDLVASFQRAVVEALVRGLVGAAREPTARRSLILTGGVAANTPAAARGREARVASSDCRSSSRRSSSPPTTRR